MVQLGRDAKVEIGRVVCVEFFIFGDRSSVAYRATENMSCYLTGEEEFPT